MLMIRKTFITAVVGLSLSLGACDKGDAKTKDQTTKTAKNTKAVDPEAKTGETKDPADEPAPEEEEEKFDDRVVKAVGLANEIEADPTNADDILAAAGMDRAAFDALMHEVSTPDLAEQYRLARAREG